MVAAPRAAARSAVAAGAAPSMVDASVSPVSGSSVSPLLPAVGDLKEPLIDSRVLAALPHNHSWRFAPPWYTALSCLFFALFFYQPYWMRVALYSRARALIDDERLFNIAGSLVVHTIVFVLANGCMALIYAAQLPFFEQFKIQQRAWPWLRGPEERAAYFSLIRKTLALIFFNVYCLQPVLLYVGYADGKKMGMGGAVKDVPAWYTSLWQICVCMILEDTLFYWAHRALHHPSVYGYVHKVHHQYKTSIGIASEYAHPIEFLFSNAIPFTAGPMLLGVHYFTLWQWTILRIGETVDGHAGYEFPWSPYRLLPWSGSSTAHDFHHSHNVGNYGSFFSFWDRMMGTDQAFEKYERKQAAMRLAQAQQAKQIQAKHVSGKEE